VSYIEILILRHLTRRPAHGYELRKRVQHTTGVRLNNNSLYPALRRFEEAGAVTRTEEPQEGRPPRFVYALTPLGRELLHDMLADLPPEQAADDTEFMARLGQFGLLDPAGRRAILDARDQALQTRLAHFAEMHALAASDRWARAVTAELIGRDERERAWIAELRTLAARDPDGYTWTIAQARPGMR
jgi:DNA-binding PadR family transcriptional regulator